MNDYRLFNPCIPCVLPGISPPEILSEIQLHSAYPSNQESKR